MDTPGTLRRMVGTVPRQRFEGCSSNGRMTSLKDLDVNWRLVSIYVLTGAVADIVEEEETVGLTFCCWSRVLITSNGCRRTQETNPLKLPAIRSEVGMVKREWTVSGSMKR